MGLFGNLFKSNKPPIYFPLVRQRIPAECGPACLCMIFEDLGWKYSLDEMNSMLKLDTALGASLLNMQQLAERLGYKTDTVSISYEDFSTGNPLTPCIIYWQASYFAVAYWARKNTVHVAHPALGYVTYNKDEFLDGWYCNPGHEDCGIIMIIYPAADE